MTRASSNNVSWRKSPASATEGCVEVAFVDSDVILVRSSRDPDGPMLRFTRAEWDAFLAGVRGGTFDAP